MRTREDIIAYLERSGHPHRELDELTWLVTDPSTDRPQILVRIVDELIVFRMKMMELDTLHADRREEFFQTLLRLNVEDMVHGAYGVFNGDVVMTATFRIENLDFNEFSATLDDFSISATNHYPQLGAFRSAA